MWKNNGMTLASQIIADHPAHWPRTWFMLFATASSVYPIVTLGWREGASVGVSESDFLNWKYI